MVPVKTRGKTKLVKRSRVRSGPDRLGGRYFDIARPLASRRGLAPVQYSASVRARRLSHRPRDHECPSVSNGVTLIKSFYLGDANMVSVQTNNDEKDRLHTDRIAGGDRDHRGLDLAPVAGRAGRTRGRAPAQCMNNLKQLGLATLNFESTYGTLPPKGQVLATPDLNVDAQAAIPYISASYITLILPYMEQSVIYNQINLIQAASDTANIPPCTGPGAIHSGNNSVYSVAIGSLLCPSSPGPATINYFNAFWGPYGDGGGDVCTPGAPAPPGNVQNLNPPPTQIWGRTDYFPIPGLHNTALQAAGMSPTYIAAGR